ncbi:MAG: RIP metalloprotease RseP [Flavobacteriaceae bacterium]|nr:RIP metalloprotease RseP [Flavobacteriaceae bacterium]
MELFIKISQFVFIISVLVILHEFGHFIPARLFKTKVEKFYLFFDAGISLLRFKVVNGVKKFSFFTKRKPEEWEEDQETTEWGIGWLPLGGYVKIAGMIDESMDKEQMKQEPKPWEFRSKPAWQRLIIMCGGVIVNFLLAWVIYSCLFVSIGETYIPINSLENGIYADENGEKLGLKTGDKIVSIDGKDVYKFRETSLDLLLGDKATVDRNGEKIKIQLTDKGKKAVLESQGINFVIPRVDATIGLVGENYKASEIGLQVDDKIVALNNEPIEFWDEFDSRIKKTGDQEVSLKVLRKNKEIEFNFKMPDSAILGLNSSTKSLQKLAITKEYSVGESIPRGLSETVNVLVKQVKQFKLIFNRTIQGYKQVKGPIGIVETMAPEWDWIYIWRFMAMFSVWLAFLNILPIPALDGGHVMFLLYEMIRGKAPSEKAMERGQIVGFIIVMTLMVLVFGNDIWNLFK